MKKKLITKGRWYYEIQIIMFVIMWQHNMEHKQMTKSKWSIRLGRLYIWYDTAWMTHGLAGEIRHHILNNKIVEFFISLYAYLELYMYGFRIGRYADPVFEGEYKRYRFFWKEKMINDFADITKHKDHFTTMRNGHVEDLPKYSLRERVNLLKKQGYTSEEIDTMIYKD